ncbi:sigma-70 family RNA polymerase sigma factor [Streptomyces werraensis]|uniref:sigma-70 family RNA polymerase sigma factor n=1 Tax=Streptomyces werraensis TaxID=68284 RepID=UPI0038241157
MSATCAGAASDLDAEARSFDHHRRRLLAIAYRVIGSRTEAEDVVQEVWMRWQRTDRRRVAAPQAYLATVTTRLSLNVVRSARWRHETFSGLAEPDRTHDAPEARVEREEAVHEAVRLLMERLGAGERAAYVLRAAFEYPYEQIAGLLHTTPANTRQLVSRARRHLARGRCVTVTSAQHRRLSTAFVAAARTGNTTCLVRLLTDTTGTGGDAAPTARGAREQD